MKLRMTATRKKALTIKSIKAKLGKNHRHKMSGSHQVGGVCKVVSRFNTKNPFSLDSALKANQFDTNARLSV
ncbi:hypothetical protein HpBGD16_09370 [Helicobacter pylori]|uniref:hypothetical protein n=1 Tax=Helicobacter pylori TaxID=210 RepID=UPI0036F3D6B2